MFRWIVAADVDVSARDEGHGVVAGGGDGVGSGDDDAVVVAGADDGGGDADQPVAFLNNLPSMVRVLA